MNKYPIGFQDFGEIIKGGYLYVDKTALIHQLINSGKYYFLSRPRRFGKSLLLATIKEIFSGRKALFEGLWIYDQWNWEQKHPVIHLKISSVNYEHFGLYNALSKELDSLAHKQGIVLEETELKDKFKELIEKASVQGKVVILIDEYDKPLIDYLDDPEKAQENRAVFKRFYSILKDADPYIRLLLITGVSRFSKISIFSDLNNLDDITLEEDMNDLVGLTQAELESTFDQELEKWSARDGISKKEMIRQVKEWYNGYSWAGQHTLYNPFSILKFMKNGRFDNFWIDTGTPSFLIKHIQEHPSIYVFNEKEVIVGADTLKDLNADNPDPVALLFQTGFLTIKEVNWKEQLFTLDYPNREVKQSMLTHITAAFSFERVGKILPVVSSLRVAFIRNDIPYIIRVLDTLFVNIPNPLWVNAKESFYHGIIFSTFQLLGINQDSEVFNAHGRVDIVVKTKTHIYALEFKLDKSADTALKQIFEREYLRKFQLDPRKRVAVGINFSSKKKAVDDYVVEDA